MKYLYYLLFVITVWLVCFLPGITLLYLFGWFDWPGLLISSLVLLPVYIHLSLYTLRHGPDWFAFVTMQWLGISAIGFPLSIPAWILATLVSNKVAAWALLCAWILLLLRASYNAHKLHDDKHTLVDQRLKKSYRLVQLSDVHIGSRTSRFLQRVVDHVIELQPDLVVITGDLVDLTRVGHTDLQALSRLPCKTYMCVGNHERYIDLEKALQAIADQGVMILRDDIVDHEELQVLGIDDADKADHVGEIMHRLAPSRERFSIALYHRPDGWSEIRSHQVSLTLSGHTHAGQIWPFYWLVKKHYPEIIGWFSHENCHLNVSSGTGTWGPTFRLGTRCEITTIELQPAQANG